ncbi:MAG: hypothetical protein C4321_09065, partial [Chloroflexota bacterium]
MAIVTLLTDFGHTDSYVGVMKGVILGLCPEAVLADLTHGLASGDVLGGALQLAAAVPYFPEGTIHLAVVDPGVGSRRRPLVARGNGAFFVGPDNGLLTLALGDAPEVRLLAHPEMGLPRVSRTFHGRDIFAPAAAHLARGVPLTEFGPSVTDWQRLALPN